MCAMVCPNIPTLRTFRSAGAAPDFSPRREAVSSECFVIPHFHRNFHHSALEWNRAGVDPIDGAIQVCWPRGRMTGHSSQAANDVRHRLLRAVEERWIGFAEIVGIHRKGTDDCCSRCIRPIHDGSMAPVIGVGDVVVTKPVSAGDLAVGDVVKYRRAGIDIVHRIVSLETTVDGLALTTKGDANNAPDRSTLTVDELTGVVIARVPKIGWITIWMNGGLN
ncbi:MAG: signal peptidase I [Chloroflexi bacterium]|nr:signal peptidase I [Chloroflexota bacterium]